ncbi:hypothetical protein TNCV_2512871 [Trichonephila clavipes]|nr:hypothetical protein TNCV_2512871 [Trichonephila clavipes]
MAIRPVTPNVPKPKKGSPLFANKTFDSNVRREGVSFTNIVSGTPTPVVNLTEKTNENSNNKDLHGIQRHSSTLVLSDLRVSLWTTGWWVPTRPPSSSLPSAPDHRPARLESTRSILIFTIILRYRSVESDLRVSLEQRIGGSLLGHRSRYSPFSSGSSTSSSSVRSLNPLLLR